MPYQNLLPMLNSLISAKHINKTYKGNGLRVEALKDVSFVLPERCLAVVYGPSGGGKSTLLHILGGIDRADSGNLEVAGVRLDQANNREINQFRREKTAFIFQFYNLLPSFNALDNVCLPLLARGMPKKQANLLAEEALGMVGLPDRIRHRPSQLSGGEQQRVAIARALVVQPDLILADEPTGDLDSQAAHSIMDLILVLNNDTKISFVIATHNVDIPNIAQQKFEIRDGRLCPG